ncbi:hypothetical protein D6833_10760 [Candidatus Parcubacteria bacterium]|nr:MAG: hypothetical protein D6833_10760 [Candidatus Parcubacteria bacterium]
MNLIIFFSSISLTMAVFEIASAAAAALSTIGRNRRLDGAYVGDAPVPQRRSTWNALLLAILPGRFDPSEAKNMANVISMLRRAGYPYSTPGEFYAAAMRTFSIYLAVGGLLAGAMVFLEMSAAAVPLAAIFVFLGLRRPYVQLRILAKKRAEAMRNNMLIGLSVLHSLLTSGTGVQEALRRVATVGGPFCNLLALLVARMEVDDFNKAIETTRAHLPDPGDIETNLFLRDVEDFYISNRPLVSSVDALREAVHRSVVEATEARAALVRQRSGLFGVLAVVGLIFSIIGPFMGTY